MQHGGKRSTGQNSVYVRTVQHKDGPYAIFFRSEVNLGFLIKLGWAFGFFIKKKEGLPVHSIAVLFFLMPLCCVDAKEVRFSGEQVLRFRIGRSGS